MKPSFASFKSALHERSLSALTIAALSVVAALGWGTALRSNAAQTAEVVHGHWTSFPRVEVPKYGGSEGVIVRSAKDTLVAGVFTHSGKYSYTFPFDEFAFVTSGSVKVSIEGGQSFTLSEGYFVFFPKGTKAHFDAGKDYANVAVFADSKPIKW